MVPRFETVLVGGGIFYLLSSRTFTPDQDIVIYGSPNSIFMQFLLLVSVASSLIIAAYLIDFGLKSFPYYESSRDWRSHAGVTQGIVEGIIGLLTAIVMMGKWLEYASLHRCLCPHQENCERLEKTWTIGLLRKISTWSRCSDWQHVVTFMPQTTLTLVVFVVALLLTFFGGSSGGEEVAIGAAGDPTPPDDPVPSDPKASTDPKDPTPSDPKTSTDPKDPTPSDPKTSTDPKDPTPSDPKASTDPKDPTPSDPKTSTDPRPLPPPPPPLCPICNHPHPHNSDNDSDSSSRGSGSSGSKSKKPNSSSSKGKKKACNNCGTCHFLTDNSKGFEFAPVLESNQPESHSDQHSSEEQIVSSEEQIDPEDPCYKVKSPSTREQMNEEISGRSTSTESRSSRRRRSIMALLDSSNDRNVEAFGTPISEEHLFVQPPAPNERIDTRRRSARINESRSRNEAKKSEEKDNNPTGKKPEKPKKKNAKNKKKEDKEDGDKNN